MASKVFFVLAALLLFVSFCNGLAVGENNEIRINTDSTVENTTPEDITTETDSTTADSTPVDSTPADSTPADSTPTDSTPADSTPADSTPADSTPADSTPADSTPADSTPADTTPADSTPEETSTETATEDPTTPVYDPAPTVETDQGDVEGIILRNRLDQPLFAYLKIAFAQPPIDDLRFKDPAPIGGLNDRTDPSVDMPVCAQSDGDATIGVEDCLYLNIYTPESDPEDPTPKPVMVFFHGGTFDEGRGSADFYDPRFLLAENVILVTVNYRLGILGFLNMGEADLNTPGNAALKDQHLALQWIKNNIGYFGGNAENICLFGQGAGAASVHLHMLSPKSQDLFHKAILQSGTAISPWAMGTSDNGVKLAEALEIPTANHEEMMTELRNTDVADILQGARSVVDGLRYANNPWTPFAAPIIENPENAESFLTGNPFDLLEKGHYHDVPLLIGFNDAEGIGVQQMLRAAGDWEANSEDLFEIIPSELNVERGTSAFDIIMGRIQEIYFEDESVNGFIPLFTDVFFAFPAFRTALEHSRTGNQSVYFYMFSADTELNVFKLRDATDPPKDGASHGDDLAYLFYIPELTPALGPAEEEAMERMVQTWTTFAKTGQPIVNDPADITTFENQWEPFTEENQNYADIGTTNTQPGVNVTTENMQLWVEIYDEFFRSAASSLQVISLVATLSVAIAHILFNHS